MHPWFKETMGNFGYTRVALNVEVSEGKTTTNKNVLSIGQSQYLSFNKK